MSSSCPSQSIHAMERQGTRGWLIETTMRDASGSRKQRLVNIFPFSECGLCRRGLDDYLTDYFCP